MWRIALVMLVACGVPTAPRHDAAIRWSPIVDSHVHLSYWAVADELAAHGIGAVVDLACPERDLKSEVRSPKSEVQLRVLHSGPMLTHPDGYPLDSWGSDGYGIGCADETCVRTTVDRLADEGARVIKLALDDDGLDPALVPAAISAAHARDLRVAVHALSDASAALAARAGADILAHTPVEPLSASTVDAWSHGAVISTLAAFGGSRAALDNLRRLRAAGTTILYGTDLGNLRDAGPSEQELCLLREAGLDDAAITAAMTTTPIAFWHLNLPTHLSLPRDPRTDATVLLSAHLD